MLDRLLSRKTVFDLIKSCDVSFKHIEISPEIRLLSSKPICLPGEFDRVSSVALTTDLEIELERLKPGKRMHSATNAYGLSDVVLYANSVVRVGNHFSGDRKARIQSFLSKPIEYEESALCSDGLTTKYFGHWLRDGLSMELLAQEMGLPPVVIKEPSWPHISGYRDLLSLPAYEIAHGHFDKLWIYDDRGLNVNRIGRLQKLRQNLRNRRKTPVSTPERVFLTRGTGSGVRTLINEDEICRTLSQNGFAIISCEDLKVDDVVSQLHNAKLCVLVEGSVQNHYLLSGPENGSLLAIQPPSQFNSFLKTFCDPIGWRWGYVVADGISQGEFRLCPERLLRTIDLFEN